MDITKRKDVYKRQLKGFTESLREEFRGKIYVGLVCPGFTKTDIFRDQKNDGGKCQKVMDMISTNCDTMVKLIMFGIEPVSYTHLRSLLAALSSGLDVREVDHLAGWRGSVLTHTREDVYKRQRLPRTPHKPR